MTFTIFDVITVLTTLVAASVAVALGAPLPGVLVASLFALACLKACFWALQRLDRR
jgi:hypothetical protein